MADVTVDVRDVHIDYPVYNNKLRPSARELFSSGFRARPTRYVHAVNGVSLTAHAGEVIGVVGSNGAGKTTLMRAIAGLLAPSRGRVLAASSPVLLSVGAVLNPSLSGRQNVILGATALGLSLSEARSRVEEIIAFAGLEDFVDLPMRAYSAGMRARLQFATAAVVEPEILLVDEALAVGDRQFQERSTARIRELVAEAGSVFVVSHNLRPIRELCSRVVWMENGQIVHDGPATEVLEEFTAEG